MSRRREDVEITYDEQANAAFIYVRPIATGAEQEFSVLDDYVENASIIASYSSDGKLLGIEILGADRVLPTELIGVAMRSAHGRGGRVVQLTTVVDDAGHVTLIDLVPDVGQRSVRSVFFDPEMPAETVVAVLEMHHLIRIEIMDPGPSSSFLKQ